VLLKCGDGVLYKDRVVADDPHLKTLGQICLDLSKPLLDLACNGNGILPRLF
jgi:hypothetical protein